MITVVTQHTGKSLPGVRSFWPAPSGAKSESSGNEIEPSIDVSIVEFVMFV